MISPLDVFLSFVFQKVFSTGVGICSVSTHTCLPKYSCDICYYCAMSWILLIKSLQLVPPSITITMADRVRDNHKKFVKIIRNK